MAGTEKEISILDLIPYITDTVSSGGTVDMTVPGNSMRPTLLDRVSKVRLKAIETPKRGDMVLYRRENGAYILHRIVKENENGTFVFCGDAQYRLEKGIRREQMLAVVSDFSRRAKWRSCDDLFYQCWWRICVQARGCRHLSAAVRRRLNKLYSALSGSV